MVNLINSLKNQMMLSSFPLSRQLLFFIFLAIVVLLHLGLLVPCWYGMIKHVEQHANVSSRSFHSQLQSEIDKTTKLLNLMSSSYTTNLARVLDSSLNGSKLSFPEIHNSVAPIFFNALSTNPHLTQILYMDQEGIVFSYYRDENQTFALYSNSSFPNNYWYTQLIDKDTGKLYGNVVRYSPSIPFNNTSLFREALNRRNGLYSFLGTRWNNTEDLMFINTAVVNGNEGLVALGFLVKEVTEFYTDMDLKGGRSYLATKDGRILAGDSLLSFELMEAHNDQIVSCYFDGKSSTRASNHLSFQGRNYMFYCSQIEMLGVQSVYVLATPGSARLINFMHRHSRTTLILLISITAFTVVSIFSFLFIIYRATIREMHLRAALIKQMEATEQAERKSMNKSLAFASASHDIRASLAGMTGLIEICYDDVSKSSDLGEKLRQMDGCTKDLLGLLNSILDTSKIEAGKMQLEEEEFDVAQLLEDVVDLYHPMCAKKGTDLILDPCDGSVYKFSRAKGDRGKVRQILCNLLSNAVKFTSDGHVSVRAWVKKPSLKSSIIVSNRRGHLMRQLSCLFYKNNRGHDEDLEDMNIAKNDPNSIELVIEVDDTGKGIPKEKQKEIFENYVQVKEISVGQGGTGLGLGIVQSLVRLMHGEIEIMDKDIGEKGTCFRFNVFLTICESAYESGTRENETELCSGDLISTPQLCVITPTPKVEGSYVVLLIRNNERRRISEKFMERLGIKVFVVERWDQLSRSLKKIKRKWNNSGSKSDLSIQNKCLTNSSSSHSTCNIGTKDNVPFSGTPMDGTDYILSLFRMSNYLRGTSSGFVLIVIDASAGPFSELCNIVNEFRNDLQNASCRVVWLANPTSHSINFYSSLEGQMIDAEDIVKYKPFHGSCLYEVVRLLPEFGGSLPRREDSTSSQVGKIPEGTRPGSSSMYDSKQYSNCEIQELGSSSSEDPLRGKKFLVADDSSLLQKLAMYNVSKLGGAVDTCSNGKEALELVSSGLTNQSKHGRPITLPYDYILMDCEMPIMSGYEATREIRKLEELYGVHIPIIALTAHTPGSEEANKTIKAGMDVYLCKPLKSEDLLEAIRYIHSKEN